MNNPLERVRQCLEKRVPHRQVVKIALNALLTELNELENLDESMMFSSIVLAYVNSNRSSLTLIEIFEVFDIISHKQ